MIDTGVNIPLQEIITDEIKRRDISLQVLRIDLIDGITGGNKYFKLKYNIEEASGQGHDTVLTFGGAFSNHIIATATAGKANGFKTIGVIRGEEPSVLSATLQDARAQGMQLIFWSREKYKHKNEFENILELEKHFGPFYLIPEGGSNKYAVKGCAEIVKEIKTDFDVACVPVGTGGTIAGLVHGLRGEQKALGFSALKDGGFLEGEVLKLLHSYEGRNFDRVAAENKIKIVTDFHFGGYAKYNNELLAFICDFKKQHNIPLDFVYTGKMMFGLLKLIEKDFFIEGTKIIAIHTGGIQGNRGLGEGSL